MLITLFSSSVLVNIQDAFSYLEMIEKISKLYNKPKENAISLKRW
jgi:hypothetical protein